MLLVAAGVAVAGCSTATPPTRERLAFARAADSICANLTDAVTPLRDNATHAVRRDDLREAARLTRKAAATATTFLDQLAKLEPPEKDRAGVERWIAGLRRQQAKNMELAAAIAARDQPGATALNYEIAGLAAQTRKFASGFGMQTCAK